MKDLTRCALLRASGASVKRVNCWVKMSLAMANFLAVLHRLFCLNATDEKINSKDRAIRGDCR